MFMSFDTLNSSTVKAGLIFLVAFVLIVFMSIGRRFLIHSSLEGVWAGFIIGVISIVALEAGLYWGGKNLMSEERSGALPQNVRMALQGGQKNINQVLGLKTEREVPTAQSVVSDFALLPNLDAGLVRGSICKEE